MICRICKSPDARSHTELCDGCWELESRIHADLDLAKKIIAKRFAWRVLYEYYNICMDEHNGHVSEEALEDYLENRFIS